VTPPARTNCIDRVKTARSYSFHPGMAPSIPACFVQNVLTSSKSAAPTSNWCMPMPTLTELCVHPASDIMQ
jgi:hypothetical protein